MFIIFCDVLIFLYSKSQVVPMICGSNHWTGNHERRYEQIITSLAGVCGTFSCVSSTVTSMKTSKPKTVCVIS